MRYPNLNSILFAIRNGAHNGNRVISLLLSFALLLVLVGASVGLFLLKVNYLAYVLAVAALLGACCYGAHQLLMKTADRNYWQA